MKNNFSVKQFFLNFLIITVKFLILLKKIILAVIVYVIYKPLRLILLFIFKRPILRLYAWYILGLKRLREFNQRHQNQYAIFNRFFSIIIITSITLVVLINNFTSRSHPESLINTAQAAPISGLISDEFDGQAGGTEELITETAANIPSCEDQTNNYANANEAILAPALPEINTNEQTIVENQNQNCLSSDQSTLNNPGLISIGQNQNNPTPNNSSTPTPEIPVKRGISNYTIKSGDTISSIARRFNVSVNTILWANNLGAYSAIREGTILRIPPNSGILYKVVRGDSIKSIAAKYNVSTASIIDDNNLDTIGKITIGQELMLSGAEKINISTPVYISKPQNTETISPTPPSETVENPSPSQLEPSAPSNTKLLWPTVGHTITQYYSWRHTGVDIANHIGTPLYAAADGVVEFAGWNSGGYGNMLFINCGGGTKLRYGHSSKLLVSVGDHVKRGQVIALMGSTGHSTGPHVHFEVYINNIRTNPLNYIR